MINFLPIFQYPITTVWVDDDKDFLSTIKRKMLTIGVAQYFHRAEDCLNFFNKYINPLSKVDFLFPDHNNEKYWDQEHLPVDFNISNVSKLNNLSPKNTEVGVLVCDYKMPNINGIELCRELKDFKFKKILLTGAAQENSAVAAFNDGVIDRFIRKDYPSLISEINKQLKILTRQYFCEITFPFISCLESDNPSPLTDKFFTYFFDEWCEDNHIKEFYLIDKNGSFLAIDQTGKQKFFITHTEKSLHNFIETYSETKQVSFVLSEMKNGNKIPFFGLGTEAWQVDFDKWGQCFYEARVLNGKQKYYVADV